MFNTNRGELLDFPLVVNLCLELHGTKYRKQNPLCQTRHFVYTFLSRSNIKRTTVTLASSIVKKLLNYIHRCNHGFGSTIR